MSQITITVNLPDTTGKLQLQKLAQNLERTVEYSVKDIPGATVSTETQGDFL
jgi:hypothetical protein